VGLESAIPSDQGPRGYVMSPMPFEIGMSPSGASPIDRILFEAAQVYSDYESNTLNLRPTKASNNKAYQNQEVWWIEREGHGRKRKKPTTDWEKGHLVRLCINNFGHYGMGWISSSNPLG